MVLELSVKDVLLAKKTYPDAKVLVHPECLPEVVKLADYVGSTLVTFSKVIFFISVQSN